MPKRTFQEMVYDPKVRTKRGITVEIAGPPFALDSMESVGLTTEMAAQEAFDQPTKSFTIEVRIIMKDRDGRRR